MPSFQNAAFAASSLLRSIGSRRANHGAASSACRASACSSGQRITPCSASSVESSTWTVDPALWTIRPARGPSGSVRGDDVGHGARRRRIERVKLELLEARGPEARAAPDRQVLIFERAPRGVAEFLDAAPVAGPGSVERCVERRLAMRPALRLSHSRHLRLRRPPGESRRSPRARAVRRARRRPRERSARPSGCGRTRA